MRFLSIYTFSPKEDAEGQSCTETMNKSPRFNGEGSPGEQSTILSGPGQSPGYLLTAHIAGDLLFPLELSLRWEVFKNMS